MPRLKLRISPVVAVLAVPLLLVVYVLSIGPMTRLGKDDYVRLSTWASIYRPLVRVAEKWPAVDRAIFWYTEKWGAGRDWNRFRANAARMSAATGREQPAPTMPRIDEHALAPRSRCGAGLVIVPLIVLPIAGS